MTLKYKKTFECIRVPLNHRLVRKMRDTIKTRIKKDNLTKNDCYELIVLYKYLNKMWKHPNARRFTMSGKGRHEYKFAKKINNRYLYISGSWYATSSARGMHIRSDWSKMNIDMLLDWLLIKRTEVLIPF